MATSSSEESRQEWTVLLSSKRRLDREKGLTALKTLLASSNLQPEDKEKIEAHVLTLITSLVGPWEDRHGGLMATGLILESGVATSSFSRQVTSSVPLLLEETESRVRIATGEVIGKLCEVCGVSVYRELEGILVTGVRVNLDRDREVVNEQQTEMVGGDGRLSSPPAFTEGSRPSSPSAAQIFHDTAGWKALETYMLALKHAVRGCGPSFQPFITSELLELIFTTLEHTNRFVRETAFKLIAAIVKVPDLSPSTTATHWPMVAQALASGLADNWSQVRMSASVATREFLVHLPPEERQPHLPTLLPAMCLNRYYVAEGVRIYSQETWRVVTQTRGVQLVEQHIDKVVDFYISQSQAANHAVREAACICTAELGTKVNKDCLRPYVGRLVSVLLECFHDDSWPVRDAACLACGNFLGCFPDECRSWLDELFLLFLTNLEDSIPSVRQGAAAALTSVTKAYGSEVEERVFVVIKERLPLAAQQPASQSSSGIDPRPAVFGVVHRIHDDPTHTDQQMYSCGSLAPKMRRGGCMDSHYHKPGEPWEKSEGALLLLGELSGVSGCGDRVSSLLPLCAETLRHRHYPQHLNLLETLLKLLPVFAKSLGKRVFKRHLELFLDSIFYGLSSDNALVQSAGVDCLTSLCQLLGRMILRGRIEQHNPTYLDKFDRTVTVA
ncbi:uncharacterized protein LOC135351009 [Halichondria panicea]|uniref:uncharacterized protein LOC135351009 n=1 Tax=Halichondria panicea TaxID=6063 RepID=UPI00312B8EFD